jgi:hypothetical protein
MSQKLKLILDKRRKPIKTFQGEYNFTICYPNKCDGHLMNNFCSSDEFKEFTQELVNRGYDITTLKIEVEKK